MTLEKYVETPGYVEGSFMLLMAIKYIIIWVITGLTGTLMFWAVVNIFFMAWPIAGLRLILRKHGRQISTGTFWWIVSMIIVSSFVISPLLPILPLLVYKLYLVFNSQFIRVRSRPR